jgi:glycosyltransferase involved in cell wall biosynthesis
MQEHSGSRAHGTVSIILPTFNRGDTIGRAIESIRRQTFEDWELIVVDDGSTDGTAEALAGLDPRIRVLRQENQGCYVARNTGLHAATGRFITFMDSDDEWRPHFLELTVAFLRAYPNEHVVMTEFDEDFGAGPEVRHDLHEAARAFPAMARRVGSQLMGLPAGETDDYLRIYSKREQLGPWGAEIAARAGYPAAVLYSGNIFEYLRFGYLGWLPAIVVTREAVDIVGDFLPTYRTAADYRFLGMLFRHFKVWMIAVPAAVKHSKAPGGQELAEGHLATGAHEYRFAVHRLPLYDEFFWKGRESDDELRRIRGLYQWYAGRVAAQLGKRPEAIRHLKEAYSAVPPLWSARLLRTWMQLAPTDAVASRGYTAVVDAREAVRNVALGKLSPAEFVEKAVRRVARI